MSSTHKFPELNLSPSKLRLSYTLGCKSTKSTKSAKSTKSKQISIQDSETPPESQIRLISLSPKKFSQSFISTKLAKLEQELDQDEISLKLNEVQHLTSKAKLKAEQKIYSKYLTKMIQKIFRIDPSIARCLDRGWRGFKKTVKDEPEQLVVEEKKNENKNEALDHSTQVTEEMIVEKVEEEIENYIGILHRAISRIGEMQMGSLIGKLNELAFSLKPVDIPSASLTPEVEEMDLEGSVRSLTSIIRARLSPKKQVHQVKKPLEAKSKATQTWMKADDFHIVDTYKASLSEKDSLIADLNIVLKRKEESEELLKGKNREIEDLKRDFLKLKYEDCPSCALKRKQLESYNSQLKSLQMTVNKGIGIDKELDETKKKLSESLNQVGISHKRILELKETIQEITAKYEDAKAQREKLQKLLMQEEEIRKNLEKQFQAQGPNSSRGGRIGKGKEPEINNSENFANHKKVQNESFIKKSSSLSPDKRRLMPKEKLTEEAKPKSSKRTTIMSILNLTKEEYLSLSKKARLEIYLSLLQHTTRCGADCEHLRRAMMIRYKDKGPLYPTKKYNIV